MTAYMERAARLACWKGAVAPEPLDGGITNVNGEHGLGDARGGTATPGRPTRYFTVYVIH